MTIRKLAIGLLLAMLPAIAASAPQTAAVSAPADLPGESVYQLSMPLVDQDGRARSLQELRGAPVLITMFYASCDNVCPMIAYHMQRIERALTEAERGQLRVVMVSFDPARDTPEALRAFARGHHVDASRWLIARAEENDVRSLAAVLGIRYREIGDGVFNHSSVITLLDAQGVIRARTADLKSVDAEFVDAVRASLD
jgi:protein SCO1/2